MDALWDAAISAAALYYFNYQTAISIQAIKPYVSVLWLCPLFIPTKQNRYPRRKTNFMFTSSSIVIKRDDRPIIWALFISLLNRVFYSATLTSSFPVIAESGVFSIAKNNNFIHEGKFQLLLLPIDFYPAISRIAAIKQMHQNVF